jgi:flagellin-like protein
MKGQEDIIALVLILMIVIALAAFAYMWFSGIFSQLMSTAGAAIERTAGTMTTQFKLESAVYDASDQKVYAVIRNIGTQSFDAFKTNFYINDAYEIAALPDCQTCICGELAKGCIAIYSISMASLPQKNILMVTIETGLQDLREISIVP